MSIQNMPRWLEIFTALVRPGSLLAMVAVLLIGGFVFAGVEFFFPGSGARASDVFVNFFSAMDENYYSTIQVMFTTYVIGRSGQAIAKDLVEARKPNGDD